MSYAPVLGDDSDIDDVDLDAFDVSDDASDNASDDGSDPYTLWAAQVASMGGTATVLPGNAIAVDVSSSTSVYTSMINAQSLPAAKYSAAQATALGLTSPDYVSPDGSTYYFVAPGAVIDFVAQNGIVQSGVTASQPAIDKAAAASLPQWFKNLETAEKALIVIAVGGAAIYVLSVLPRRRNG